MRHLLFAGVVYVACQGPLWSAGGERGLYKSTDGGASWNKILGGGEYTGVNEVRMDPRDPEVLYATTHQRFRNVAALVNGGPETAIHKSTDGGSTWRKLTKGLPKEDMGKIGLAISPQKPDVIYATIELGHRKGGFYRSTDGGASWEKRNDYISGGTGPHYYQEIFACPHQFDRVYQMDVRLHVTEDGGKTFRKLGHRTKHSDNHAMAFSPHDPDYLIVGCDGGIYESWDLGEHWRFAANLPLTQFYKVAVDYDEPFYNIIGGTQDNSTQHGPSRTDNIHGIRNSDWMITVFGDGHQPAIDPTNPDIIYSQWQEGNLVRHDRKTGEIIYIQPQPRADEPTERFNWDSPILISPHDPARLYFASQRIWRSDDRGGSWMPVSKDLTRNLDRLREPMMGRVWSVDAVWDLYAMSKFCTTTSLAESPIIEGLLYAGTDDGLIRVSENGGRSWRVIDQLPGVADKFFVNDIKADLYDADTVYACVDQHKTGDFAPYIFKSTDRGASWTSITGDLPDRHLVWRLVQDHVEPNLLFAGTEFGVFFTFDGGGAWHRLKGLPTIQARDIDIQRRVNDLVIGTFGRGFWILDDYSVLRELSEEALADNEVLLFPTREALRYTEKRNRQGSRGDGFWTADNPPYGAVFTYWLRDGLKTAQEVRTEAEKEARKNESDPPLPTMAELRDEDLEIEPEVLLVIRDELGEIVRRVPTERTAGLHRVAWDLRWPAADPVSMGGGPRSPWWQAPRGPLALPGRYEATLESRIDGEFTALAGPVGFDVIPLDLATFTAEDKEAVMAFQAEVRELRRRVMGASRASGELRDRIDHLRVALRDTPAAPGALSTELEAIRADLDAVDLELSGDDTKSARNVFQPPSIGSRVGRIASDLWSHTQPPTTTHRQALTWAAEAFETQLTDLKQLDTRLRDLESRAEATGAPWTPGRLPQ
jgi:photosystem II stability/assembly factor-like uncharacterized protein